MNSKMKRLITSAEGDIANARRYLDSGEAVNWVCDNIRSGLMWAINAWLLYKGFTPDFGNGWHSMRTQFYEVAPQRLRSNISDCLAKENFLSYQLEGCFDIDEPLLSMEEWKRQIYICLEKAEEIIATIEQDILQK